jgi:CheY-like chemotaxis protein
VQQLAKRHHDPKDEDSLPARLGVVIRTYRQQLGISQEELAWRANMHRTYISDIERGARNVTVKSVANLAKAFQTTVGNLFSYASAPEDDAVRDLIAHSARPREILLVEDDAADAELALRAFKCAKFTNPFKVVRNAEEAWDYLFALGRYAKRVASPPQLILLDIHLPTMSGLEFLRRLKAEERTREIPVVILTGSRDDRLIIECSRLGAENYIVKPLAPENFLRVTPKLNLHVTLGSSPASEEETAPGERPG